MNRNTCGARVEPMKCKNLQVHVIHKLTKDISMLRRKKTKSESDKSKNERKVARFVQEVQVMTKMWTGSVGECFCYDNGQSNGHNFVNQFGNERMYLYFKI